MTTVKIAGVVAGGVLIVAAIIFYEVSVWRECLSHDSWWYCLRVLGK